MTEQDVVRVGVIGVGTMGEHHARVYSELAGAELIGVADADRERASAVGEAHGSIARPTEELIEEADAVSIAVPTSAHADLALDCIESGTDLIVEKPFVLDPAEGRKVARRAEKRNVVLQVGHIERFNPAIRALFDLVDPAEIIAIRADRLGPPVGRQVSDDVVTDLMIHDIDIVLALMGEQPTSVSAVSREESYASALCEFNAGIVATLTASRVTQRKVRTMEVTTGNRHLAIDYINQSVKIHRRSRPSYLQDDAEMRYRHESIIEQPLIESAEPLKLELEAFLEAVRNRSTPQVTAKDGLQALSVVWSIKQQLAKPMEVPTA